MRSNYYAFLCASLIWMFLIMGFASQIMSAIGALWYLLWGVSALVLLVSSQWFTCPFCDHPLVRPKMTVGNREVTGYGMFPGRTCTSCGEDVTR
jgi:hypothetical protein